MNNRRRITGVVTSNKMDKTVVVEIGRTFRHPLYGKVVHSSKRVMAHDELGCEIGDEVRIVESRPISRRKHWVVEEILRRDVVASEAEAVLAETVDVEIGEAETGEESEGETEAEA